MSGQEIISIEDIPSNWSLLWDNIKTTTIFGGAIGGILPAAGCGFLTAMIGNTPELGVKVGIGIGVATFGPVTSVLFSLPFTLAAAKTREFKANTLIDPLAKLLLDCKDKKDQKRIIQQIIEMNNNLSWWGIRSFESAFLINKLESLENSKEEKWNAVLNYLKKSDDNTYTQNGKKLFNGILDVIKNNEADLILHNAILENDITTLEKYAENYPQILNQADKNGLTLLHYAALNNRPEIVEYLLTKEAILDNINIAVSFKNIKNSNKNALHIAAEYGHTEIVLMLLNQGGKISRTLHPVHIAARFGKLATVKNLTEQQPSLLAKKDKACHQTPLIFAAANGHLKVVQYLCLAKKNLRLEDATYAPKQEPDGRTALQWAVHNGHENVAHFLHVKGAIDKKTDELKANLHALTLIVNNPDWQQEGWSIFQKHTPHGIIHLREKLQINLDKMYRGHVLKLIKELKKWAHTQKQKLFTIRSDNTKNLYELVENLEDHTNTYFEKLEKFKVDDITYSRHKIIN